MELPRSRRLRLLPAIIYMAVIFYFSSIPGPRLRIPPGADDRALHFVEYFGLGLTLLFAATALGSAALRGAHFAGSAVAGILYGVSDEVHQAFVPQRDASLVDLAFDAAGVLSSLALAALILMRLRRP